MEIYTVLQGMCQPQGASTQQERIRGPSGLLLGHAVDRAESRHEVETGDAHHAAPVQHFP